MTIAGEICVPNLMLWHNRLNINRRFFCMKVTFFKQYHLAIISTHFAIRKPTNYLKKSVHIIYYNLHEKYIVNVKVTFSLSHIRSTAYLIYY